MKRSIIFSLTLLLLVPLTAFAGGLEDFLGNGLHHGLHDLAPADDAYLAKMAPILLIAIGEGAK
jgi:hypothetical protein